MKLNWGNKIALVYIVFVIAILFLVYLCGKHPDDLVSTNYYEKELKYQDQINMETNSNALQNKLYVDYDAGSKELVLKFPADMKGKPIKGGLTFFKPDNATLDFNKIINVDDNNEQHISSADMSHGVWRIKATWSYNSKSYYQETRVFIE